MAPFIEFEHVVDEVWQKSRFGTITVSVSYGLFTYSKNKSPNWDKKLESVFNSDFKGNEDTERGLMYEDDAKERYEQEKKDLKCITPGIIFNRIVPWFGYSADGVICKENEVVRLWECKTPKKGKNHGSSSISGCVSYIDRKTLKLKHLHPFYGQIHLGMLMTSTQDCDFTTYCYGPDEVLIENVVLNETFALKFIDVLTHTYFKHILPWLVKKIKEKSLLSPEYAS